MVTDMKGRKLTTCPLVADKFTWSAEMFMNDLCYAVKVAKCTL